MKNCITFESFIKFQKMNGKIWKINCLTLTSRSYDETKTQMIIFFLSHMHCGHYNFIFSFRKPKFLANLKITWEKSRFFSPMVIFSFYKVSSGFLFLWKFIEYSLKSLLYLFHLCIFQVPWFPECFNTIYDNDPAVYTYHRLDEY
jgi:hypothetical protein